MTQEHHTFLEKHLKHRWGPQGHLEAHALPAEPEQGAQSYSSHLHLSSKQLCRLCWQWSPVLMSHRSCWQRQQLWHTVPVYASKSLVPCLNVSVYVLNLACRALRGQFRASINWVRNFCSWNQMLPVRWYFYGRVNEERRKTGILFRSCMGSWVIKQVPMANICGGVDYESVTFQLKGSVSEEKLLSKIFFMIYLKGRSLDGLKELITKDS